MEEAQRREVCARIEELVEQASANRERFEKQCAGMSREEQRTCVLKSLRILDETIELGESVGLPMTKEKLIFNFLLTMVVKMFATESEDANA